MGYTMNSILAWFITFNFINISWVFFRAKEWDDAIKVLRGMFGGNGVVLPAKLEKYFISSITYSNAWLSNIYADKYIILELFLAFFIILIFKNTIEIKNNLKFNMYTMLFTTVVIITSLLHLKGVHEFLYFNF
jgi:hypothetical protein